MRTSINFLAFLFLACVGDGCWGTEPGTPLAAAFVSVFPGVAATTRIPILLPSNLPSPVGGAIHYATGHGGDRGYEITLYFEEGTGDAGFAGYFSGKLDKQPLMGRGVKLEHGLTGYFRASTCGGSCSPSQIEWYAHGVRYTAQLRLNADVRHQLNIMVAVADSAITSGPR